MPFHNPFKKESSSRSLSKDASEGLPAINVINEAQDGAIGDNIAPNDPDRKDVQSDSTDMSLGEPAMPPAYNKQSKSQSQPPRYRSLQPDPHDPNGVPYGYQYEENEQNFAHPSSAAKDIGKPMNYSNPKHAELARRASEAGRDDLREMMNYHLRQQEIGKKSIDNSNFAWNGV
jgi:hypothetical protein